MSVELWMAGGGLALGAAGFGTGLWQYRQAQRWKRVEFLLEEMREFRENKDVQTALLLLDWNVATAGMLPSPLPPGVAAIDDADLMRALVPHEDRPEGFDATEVCVRRVFDALLDRFERYGHYVQSGFFSRKDFEPYLGYWLKLIAEDGRKPEGFRGTFYRYMAAYYTDAAHLFRAFGHDVTPSRRVTTMAPTGERPMPPPLKR